MRIQSLLDLRTVLSVPGKQSRNNQYRPACNMPLTGYATYSLAVHRAILWTRWTRRPLAHDRSIVVIMPDINIYSAAAGHKARLSRRMRDDRYAAVYKYMAAFIRRRQYCGNVGESIKSPESDNQRADLPESSDCKERRCRSWGRAVLRDAARLAHLRRQLMHALGLSSRPSVPVPAVDEAMYCRQRLLSTEALTTHGNWRGTRDGYRLFGQSKSLRQGTKMITQLEKCATFDIRVAKEIFEWRPNRQKITRKAKEAPDWLY